MSCKLLDGDQIKVKQKIQDRESRLAGAISMYGNTEGNKMPMSFGLGARTLAESIPEPTDYEVRMWGY